VRRVCLALALLAVLPGSAAGMSIAADETRACAAFGPKHPGSAADRAEAERIADRFRAGGLETSFESFHMPVWEPGTTTLTDNAPTAHAFTAESFAYSGTGTVTAEAIEVNPAILARLGAAGDLKGKIVVVDAGLEHRTAVLDEVVRRGAVGMVLISGPKDDLIATGSVRWGYRPPAPIPAVTIAASSGAAIYADLDNGPVRLTVSVAGQRVDAVGRNVIGIRRGTTYPDRYVVVGAHYDAWYAGAVDNCSAIGTMLQMVADSAGTAPAYSVIFAAWDAEETGLVGSYSWIIRHPDLVAATVLNINLEMTGGLPLINGVDAINPVTAAGTENPVVTGLLTDAAVAAGYVPVLLTVAAYRAAVGGIIATDLEGFFAAGVQGLSTVTGTDYYHTVKDTFDTINLAVLDGQTAFAKNILGEAQRITPDAFTIVRQVPTVKIDAPPAAPAGAAVPMTVRVTDVDGAPITGASVRMLASQRDNWALTEQYATELSGGLYRWTLPAGITDTGRTLLRATVTSPTYIATDHAAIDQTGGGILAPGSVCRSRRVITVHVHAPRGSTIRATATRGHARLLRGGRVRVDLRRVLRGTVTVRISVRTRGGRVLRQQRVYRTCRRAR
jgi:hypothetical protein